MSLTDDELELAPELRQVEALLLGAREVALPPDLGARARAAEPDPAFDVRPAPRQADEADVAFGRFLVERGALTADQLREALRQLGAYRVQRPGVNLAQVLAKHGLCEKARLLAAHEAFMAALSVPPAAAPPEAVGSPVEEARGGAPAKAEEEKTMPGLQVHVLGPSVDRARARERAGRRYRPLLAGVATVLALGVSGAAALSVVSSDRRRRKEEFLAGARTVVRDTRDSGWLVANQRRLTDTIARRAELPGALLEDAEVVAAGADLEAALARTIARAASLEVLVTLRAARDPDERLEIAQRAVEADPTHADALVARARARYAVTRSRAVSGERRRSPLAAEALADLDEAIRQGPREALACLVKGLLLIDLHRGGDACEPLRLARDRAPGTALGALAEGLLSALPEQLDTAIRGYNRALELDPAFVDAYLARGRARLLRREFGKALEDANQALRQDPSSPDALILQAESRYFASAAGDRTGALATIEKALRLDPSEPRALALRAYVRLERDRIGDLTSAPEDQAWSKRDAERAIAGYAGEPLAHLALAEVTAATNPVEAKQHASRAIECGRHLPHTWMCRGRLRGKEADEYAIQDFEEVLRMDPANALALTNKAAVLFAARRDPEQATVLLDRAIELEPDLPWAYYWRAMIALAPPRNTQKYAQAVTDFSEAIARQPQFPDAYFRRACAYHDTGRYLDCLKDLATAEAQRGQKGGTSASAGTFQQHWVELMRGHCLFFTRQYPEARAAYERYRDKAPPGDKVLPGVVRRLDELRRLEAGELTADELSTDIFDEHRRR